MKIPAISTITPHNSAKNGKFVRYGICALALSAMPLVGSCTKERGFEDFISQPKSPQNEPVNILINDSVKTYLFDYNI